MANPTPSQLRQRWETGNTPADSAVGVYDTTLRSTNPNLYFKFTEGIRYEKRVTSLNPLGYWKMDDGKGLRVLDRAGNNNGTISNNGSGTHALYQTSLVPADVKRCIDLQAPASPTTNLGNGARIDLDNTLSLSFPFTIEAWIQPQINTVSSYYVFCTHRNTTNRNGAGITVYTDGRLGAIVADGTGGYTSSTYRLFQTAAATLVGGTTYHVAAVFNAYNDVDIYINGELQVIDVTSGTGTGLGQSGTASIGSGTDSATIGYMRGKVDEVALYSSALSASDILLNYKIGTTTTFKDTFNNVVNATNNSVIENRNTLLGNDSDNESIAFDETNRSIKIGRYFNYTDKFSIECLVRINTTSDGLDKPILTRLGSGTNDNVKLYTNNNTLFFGVRDSDTTTWRTASIVITQNTVYHIVAIYDKDITNKLQIFLNGHLVATNTSSFIIDTTSVNERDTYIGRMGDTTGARFFGGQIDELAIYDTNISTSVLTHHDASNTNEYDADVLSGPSLSAFYHLNDSISPTLKDSSGNGRDLTAVGTYTFRQAQLSKSNDYSIDIGNTTTTTLNGPSLGAISFPYTIEAWVNPDSITGTHVIAQTHGQTIAYKGFTVLMEGAEIWAIMGVGGSGFGTTTGKRFKTTSAPMVVGETQHIVVVFRSFYEVEIWINGILEPNITFDGTDGTLLTNSGILKIGSGIVLFSGDHSPLDGKIDEVALYATALSQERIEQHYLLGINTTLRDSIVASSPVAYHRLDESSSTTTAFDSSGNGYNGTYTGRYIKNRNPIMPAMKNAVEFNSLKAGNESHVEVGNLGATALSFPITMEAFILCNDVDSAVRTYILSTHMPTNPPTTPGYQGIQFRVSLGRPALVMGDGLGALGSFNAALNARGYSGGPIGFIKNGKPYHVVAVIRGYSSTSDVDFYINGVKQTTNTESWTGGATDLNTTDQNYVIGGGNSSGSANVENYFNGVISHVALYNIELKSPTIKNHYILSKVQPKFKTLDKILTRDHRPHFHYEFENVISNTVTDQSGNGYNGTITTAGNGIVAKNQRTLSKVDNFRNSSHEYRGYKTDKSGVEGPSIGTISYPLSVELLFQPKGVSAGSDSGISSLISTHDAADTYRGIRANVNTARQLIFYICSGETGTLSSTACNSFTVAGGSDVLSQQGIYHVVFVARSKTKVEVWVNGIKRTVTNVLNISNDLVSSTGVLRISQQQWADAIYSGNNIFDKVALYDKDLSRHDIIDLYKEIVKNQPSYNTEVLADSPEIYWKLNETSGTTITDSSGNANHATISGDYVLNSDALCVANNSIRLDSDITRDDPNGGQIVGPSLGAMSFPVTLEAWVKMTLDDLNGLWILSTHYYAPSRTGYFNWIQADGRVLCGYGNGAHGSTTNRNLATTVDPIIESGKTYHIVCVINGLNNQQIYVNGKQYTVSYGGTAASADTSNGVPTVFKGSGAGFAGYSRGYVSNTAIYNSALSQRRIEEHYTAGLISRLNEPQEKTYEDLVRNKSPLVYTKLNEVTGTVIHDYSGNNNNGTLVGAVNTLKGLSIRSKMPSWSLSIAGGSGVNGGVDGVSLGSLTYPVSLEAFIRPSTNTVWNPIIYTHDSGGRSGFELAMGTDGKLIAKIGGNNTQLADTYDVTVKGKTVLQTSKDYHVVATFFGDTAEEIFIYVNGVDDTDSATHSIGVNYTALDVSTGVYRIGKGYDTTNSYSFQGNISNAVIYDSAVRYVDAEEHHAAGIINDQYHRIDYVQDVIDNTPVLYWKLDETFGTSITDYSGNNKTGTIAGTHTLEQESLIRVGTNSIYFGSTGQGSVAQITAASLGTISFPITLECWWQPDNLGSTLIPLLSTHFVENVYNGFNIFVEAVSGHITALWGNGSGVASTNYKQWQYQNAPLAVGNLYYIVAVFTSTTATTLYINGYPVSTVNTGTAASPAVSSGTPSLGRIDNSASGSNTWGARGYYHHAAIYNVALEAHQVRNRWFAHKIR